MIFGMFSKKLPPVPVDAGQVVQIEIPGEKSARTLYAKVEKVSKKRNIFVHFVSKDGGENLQVGAKGTLSALKTDEVVSFPTELLHVKEKTFIFSSSELVSSRKIPSGSKGLTFRLGVPVAYRAMASLHQQKGILENFSMDYLEILANLPVPAATVLQVEFPLPHMEKPIEFKGKVSACARREEEKKYRVRVSLEEVSAEKKEEILAYGLLTMEGFPPPDAK